MRNPNLVPYEIIVRATNGEPEAVDGVLPKASGQSRIIWISRNFRQRSIRACFISC